MPPRHFVALRHFAVLLISPTKHRQSKWKATMSSRSSSANGATAAPPAEVHILWITAGLSCDGDSVSVTAAEQPSIEDVLMGAIPGLPKVHLHNPVLAYENGDEFMKFFYEAEKGILEPFVLVVEGSIPN